MNRYKFGSTTDVRREPQSSCCHKKRSHPVCFYSFGDLVLVFGFAAFRVVSIRNHDGLDACPELDVGVARLANSLAYRWQLNAFILRNGRYSSRLLSPNGFSLLSVGTSAMAHLRGPLEPGAVFKNIRLEFNLGLICLLVAVLSLW